MGHIRECPDHFESVKRGLKQRKVSGSTQKHAFESQVPTSQSGAPSKVSQK